MNKIEKIIDSHLCIGCGLCEALYPEKFSMSLKNGFYYPLPKSPLTKQEDRLLYECCPGARIKGNGNSEVWGNVISVKEGWAKDINIRRKSSSGGVISSLAIYLLNSGQVDAVLQVGKADNSYLYNCLKVSRSVKEVIQNAGSRYAPACLFKDLKNILDASEERFVFIGKPCDIAGLKNFLSVFPKYKNRILFFLSIFCAGMPSYEGTEAVLKCSGYDEKPLSLKYRGDGWPGYFEAFYKDKPAFKMSYNDSWGKILGKHLDLRCKICPDGIGLLADIAVGDSWNTKDGYPDFSESDGKSFVLVRTAKGASLLNEVVHNSEMSISELEINKIKDMQNYQYNRRLLAPYRIMAIQLLTGGLLKYDGIGINSLLFKGQYKRGFRDFLGTFKRFINLKG